ncbi:MAG: D-alanyl-D-alanine carboxypeptidase family protein [Endozoicomonas sp.]|uniref:D-alanyl-D-alanine carboxypeptidase family protein n=1 Tax=Endozoicomonas sp. TaxID=1892382 RepID=UPI003D9B05C6
MKRPCFTIKTLLSGHILTFCLALISSHALAVTTIIPNAPVINAKGFVLMDYDSGQIIASENGETPLAPASLTKMMTAYIIGQEITSERLSFDDTVTISRNAWSRNFPDSSKMFIEPGDKISVANLTRGIMVQSGNDASVAMAEHIVGSEGAFVDLMNSWTTRLGMTNTQFINAHGLDGESIATTPRSLSDLRLFRPKFQKERPNYSMNSIK